MGQVRALKLQLENSYNTRLTSKHPIMPWMVKQAAYLLNRYAIHADGNTSYYRRWNKEHKTPICDCGETVLYMLPKAKQMAKMGARFFPAIWLGKDTSTNENILGITNKVVRSRTIRRQVKPEKYNKQLLDVINNAPMTTPRRASFVMLPTAKMMARPRQQRHKHLFNRKSYFPQRQHNQQHIQASHRPSQTCRWQQHHQHKEQEHPCQCQHQKETWQMK